MQPVMWSFAMDSLNLTQPDFLVLADECHDYYYPIVADDNKTYHVLNPGNFAQDQSFTVVYPFAGIVQPSKVDL